MSLIVVRRCQDGVVIGVDNCYSVDWGDGVQGSIGPPKIEKFGQDKIWGDCFTNRDLASEIKNILKEHENKSLAEIYNQRYNLKYKINRILTDGGYTENDRCTLIIIQNVNDKPILEISINIYADPIQINYHNFYECLAFGTGTSWARAAATRLGDKAKGPNLTVSEAKKIVYNSILDTIRSGGFHDVREPIDIGIVNNGTIHILDRNSAEYLALKNQGEKLPQKPAFSNKVKTGIIVSVVIILIALLSILFLLPKKPTPKNIKLPPSDKIDIEGMTQIGNNLRGYKEYRHKQTGIVFVYIPGGTLKTGQIISDFLVSKYELTQAIWQKTMANNAPNTKNGIDYPAVNISWNDCQEFCQKTGLRLPTAAEWDYICAKDSDKGIDDSAWYFANSEGKLQKIGQKDPNSYGLYDVLGNAWEWCQDTYQGNGTDKNIDGKIKVIKGGAFYSLKEDIEISYSSWCEESQKLPGIGLRCAYDAK